MSQERKLELYKLLKERGFQLEQLINERLRERADSPEVVQEARIQAKVHAAAVSQLQKYMELLGIQLNIPTKNDVANVAKLTAQVEGKVDDMEAQLYRLANAVENMERTLGKDPGTRK